VSAATAARLALLIGLGALALGCDDETRPEKETVQVKVSGTCAAGPTTAELTSEACGVTLESSDPTLRLPAMGQLDQAREPWRQGGWQIYGGVCATGQSCGDFRRCIATRVASHLVLDCLDGSGAAICQAELRE
jgi:hypothetical protein